MSTIPDTVDVALEGWLQRVNALCGRFCAKALGDEFAGRIVLAPGGITLIDAARPSEFEYGAGSRQLSLILPRKVIERSLRFASVRSCARIAAHTPVAVLTHGLVRESARQEGLSLAESEATLDALVSLLRPALGYDFGFSDASYFSSAFKARFGVAPGEYRKRYRPD